MPEENYDEDYVVNILAEKAYLKLKYIERIYNYSRTNQSAAKPQSKEKNDSQKKNERRAD